MGGVRDNAARCTARRPDRKISVDRRSTRYRQSQFSLVAWSMLAEIDGLIEQLRSIGITPVEMRASFPRLRIPYRGTAGRCDLRSMQWAARFEAERT